jgi:hypothetical protein
MRTKLTLSLTLLLLVSSVTFAQKPGAMNAAANRSWQSFWQQIVVAVNKKDRVALLRMMPGDFSDGGGGLTASEWLQFIDKNDGNGSWRDLRKSFARGTVVNKNWSSKGTPTRVTRDNGYYFEFRKDKRWYFAGVVGD